MNSPSPFRSTTAFATRRRTRPAVERSVFVIATAGKWRVAIPVERVERVVRLVAADTVMYAGRKLRVRDLGLALGARDGADARDEATDVVTPDVRFLIVSDGVRDDSCYAAKVCSVHEVYAVETALVLPVSSHGDRAPLPPALRGVFTRNDQPVWVLDLTRLLEPS